MANRITGTFTLQQMIELTRSNKENRFEYMERDVLKRILIRKVRKLNPDRPNEPSITYEFISYSNPQYSPYTNHSKGKKQRKYKHQYNQILSIEADENGKASLNTTTWKYRLGSEKTPVKRVSQKFIKAILNTTSQKWKGELEYDIKKANGDKKKIAKAKADYRKKIADHKKRAPYLDLGDYISRVQGINLDFYYRSGPILDYYGHLYGKNPTNSYGDIQRPFMCKHALALLDFLIRKGILQ